MENSEGKNEFEPLAEKFVDVMSTSDRLDIDVPRPVEGKTVVMGRVVGPELAAALDEVGNAVRETTSESQLYDLEDALKSAAEKKGLDPQITFKALDHQIGTIRNEEGEEGLPEYLRVNKG